MENLVNKLYLGDCIDIMSKLPDNSIDCIVSDPPYGIAFMSKEWDKALPNIQAFKQMFRVLKPGALAFVMSSPRQDVLWRMLQMLENVGFELKQSFVSWIYKTGFPKAYDVSKGIDKKFKKKRKVVGKRKKLDSFSEGYHSGDKEGKDYSDINIEITEANSELAKKWNGWKSITGLKPALECILMVNKPMSEATIVDNVLKYGTGAMNVDGCRIPFKDNNDKQHPDGFLWETKKGNVYGGGKGLGNGEKRLTYNNKGRFPANLLCSSAIDYDLNEILELQEELKNEKS